MPLYPPVYPSARIIASGSAEVANAGAGWEVAKTVTLDAGLLRNDHDKIIIRAAAQNAANGNTKGFRVQLGGVALGSNAHAGNGTNTVWEIVLRRTGAATGKALSEFTYGNSSIYLYNEAALTPTWANALALTIEIQGATAPGDITAQAYEILYIPAVS